MVFVLILGTRSPISLSNATRRMVKLSFTSSNSSTARRRAWRRAPVEKTSFASSSLSVARRAAPRPSVNVELETSSLSSNLLSSAARATTAGSSLSIFANFSTRTRMRSARFVSNNTAEAASPASAARPILASVARSSAFMIPGDAARRLASAVSSTDMAASLIGRRARMVLTRSMSTASSTLRRDDRSSRSAATAPVSSSRLSPAANSNCRPFRPSPLTRLRNLTPPMMAGSRAESRSGNASSARRVALRPLNALTVPPMASGCMTANKSPGAMPEKRPAKRRLS